MVFSKMNIPGLDLNCRLPDNRKPACINPPIPNPHDLQTAVKRLRHHRLLKAGHSRAGARATPEPAMQETAKKSSAKKISDPK